MNFKNKDAKHIVENTFFFLNLRLELVRPVQLVQACLDGRACFAFDAVEPLAWHSLAHSA